MQNIKAEKVKNNFKRSLYEVFLKLGYTQIMIDRLILSADFKYLTVEISCVDGNSLELLVQKLNNDHYIIKLLTNKLKGINFPKIRFIKDSHEERINRITKIISEVEKTL